MSDFSLWLLPIPRVCLKCSRLNRYNILCDLIILYLIGEILRGRIVGGIEGDYGEFKYQVTIQKISKRAGHMFHLCGGCIISSRHILTAAHCVKDVSGVADATKDLLVVSGTGIIVPGAGTTHKIKSVIINPSYSGKIEDSWKNDIAIITVSLNK